MTDAKNGDLIEQSGIKITRAENGMIAYSAAKNSVTGYNSIETPKGGEFKIVLPDGSKVWLNASSSLRYPTSFLGSERKVELTGEAYFEVAKNVLKPFKVAGSDQVVEVLGTQFNISSYVDDAAVKTTLLEGSVRVLSNKSSQVKMLKPGEQSNISYSANVFSVKQVDVEQAVAWKNGYFLFVDEDLKSIMRKFERWYDVDVEYKGNADDLRFGGIVSRSKSLSQALKIVEQTGNLKIKIEGRRVAIMP